MSDPYDNGYTPETGHVKRAYVVAVGMPTLSEAQFTRWLTEHDRQVAEKAWDEGKEAEGEAHAQDNGYGNVEHPKNPYQKRARN